MPNDVMLSLVPILSFVFLHLITSSSPCQSNATLWTYYPCSFIISSNSMDCQHLLVTSSVAQCLNKDMTFFWHFPIGSMRLTLQADDNQPFLLNISRAAFSNNRLIKNTSHLVEGQPSEERVILNDENEMITLSSDQHNRCSIRFETTNSNIYDYGTFIRLRVFNNKHENR